MKIAIVHFHLNRGGVARVITNHLQALNGVVLAEDSPLQVALLYGGRADDFPFELIDSLDALDVSLLPISELDYDSERKKNDDLFVQLDSNLKSIGFQPDETILHFHNHSLGKNAELPDAIARLAKSGYACLLQIHDFAEDFRPTHYQHLVANACDGDFERLPGILYPQAARVHYAVLNGRDQAILTTAGINPGQLHFLPNSIAKGKHPEKEPVRNKLERLFGISPQDRLLIYPVRGIRRKNLGEAMLWSALADEQTSFVLTLAPLNPVETGNYERWKKFAQTHGLKWHFDLGSSSELTYPEILAAADLILSTSITEGFGMVFLEAWLADRELVGRNLPAITSDFVNVGMQFPGLAPSVLIPVEWIGKDKLRASFIDSFKQVLASFGQPTPQECSLHEKFDQIVNNEMIDFAFCNTDFQRQIIERVIGSETDRDRILKINPKMHQALERPVSDDALIRSNIDIISKEYSLERSGDRLNQIYQLLLDSKPDEFLSPLPHGNTVLETFLDLTHFHPLRVES